jgi:hypothetical protein
MSADEQEDEQGDPGERAKLAPPVVVDKDQPEKPGDHPEQKDSKAGKSIRKGWTSYKIASIVVQLLTLAVILFYTIVTYRMACRPRGQQAVGRGPGFR